MKSACSPCRVLEIADVLIGALRGASAWSVGERELFARRTERSHTARSRRGRSETRQRWTRCLTTTEPHPSTKNAGHAAFLEKITQEAGQMGKRDVDRLREFHVSDKAIEDALHVCVLAIAVKYAMQHLRRSLRPTQVCQRARDAGASIAKACHARLPRLLRLTEEAFSQI